MKVATSWPRALGLAGMLLGLLWAVDDRFPSPAQAAGPRFFRQATAKDFEDGEPDGTMLLPDGTLWPGRTATRVGISAAFVWSSARSRDGQTAYFGSGDDGRVWAVPLGRAVSGKSAIGAASVAASAKATETARPLATLEGPWVTALAVRADGSVLAGLTPKGRVALVEPAKNTVRLFGRVEAEHVWCLAHDDATGQTWVGAGMPGKLFLLDAQGKARTVWDSGDEHVVALALETSGTVLAGTSDDGILYRVTAAGRAQALQDFDADEVRAILRVGDTIFVAVNDFESSAVTVPGPPVAKGTAINLAAGGPSPASAGGLPRPGAVKAKSAVYRLEADGRTEQLFALGDGYLTSLAAGPDGSVFVGSGTRGRVYQVWPDRRYGLVVDLPERQALTLLPAGDELVIGTGDVGGIYRTHPARLGLAGEAGQHGARYLSKVLDADPGAHWGRLRWQGARRIAFETRTGNTAKPDATWSSWQVLTGVADETGGAGGQAQSPAGRFLQYRATWGEAGPLRSVVVAALPQNLRPRVSEVGLAEEGSIGSSSGGSVGAARPPHSSTLKVRWKLDNPDSDEVVFRVGFRRLGDPVWRPVGGSEPLTKAELDWNTDGLADGLYEVHVVASDERGNPPERSLTSEARSAPLLVDNRSPSFTALSATYPVVKGRAHDDGSPLQFLEFSVDGGEWRPFAPTDGIADHTDESFQFSLSALAHGSHVVGLRAVDTAGNVGGAQVGLVVK